MPIEVTFGKPPIYFDKPNDNSSGPSTVFDFYRQKLPPILSSLGVENPDEDTVMWLAYLRNLESYPALMQLCVDALTLQAQATEAINNFLENINQAETHDQLKPGTFINFSHLFAEIMGNPRIHANTSQITDKEDQ